MRGTSRHRSQREESVCAQGRCFDVSGRCSFQHEVSAEQRCPPRVVLFIKCHLAAPVMRLGRARRRGSRRAARVSHHRRGHERDAMPGAAHSRTQVHVLGVQERTARRRGRPPRAPARRASQQAPLTQSGNRGALRLTLDPRRRSAASPARMSRARAASATAPPRARCAGRTTAPRGRRRPRCAGRRSPIVGSPSSAAISRSTALRRDRGIRVQEQQPVAASWRGCRGCWRGEPEVGVQSAAACTDGQSRASMAVVPSCEALSTTTMSCGGCGAWSRSASQAHRQRGAELNDDDDDGQTRHRLPSGRAPARPACPRRCGSRCSVRRRRGPPRPAARARRDRRAPVRARPRRAPARARHTVCGRRRKSPAPPACPAPPPGCRPRWRRAASDRTPRTRTERRTPTPGRRARPARRR